MTQWVISEAAVTVNYPYYTRAAVAIAAMILCGGLSAPFAV